MIATGADRAEYFMASNPPGYHFNSNQICFYPHYGKVFPLPESQANFFFFYAMSIESRCVELSTFFFNMWLVSQEKEIHNTVGSQ